MPKTNNKNRNFKHLNKEVILNNNFILTFNVNFNA